MICSGCGNDRAYAVRIRFSEGGKVESCDMCSAGFRGVPDVYFKGAYWDENLATHEHPGPKFITSRQEKKHWLEKCNVRESGDRVHGASAFDKISHRHAMESLNRR